MNGIIYRKTNRGDSEKIADLITERWGDEYIVVHNTIYLPKNLDGFAAIIENKIAGVVTYIIENNKCEIVTLDSFEQNKGIGSRLIELVIKEAKEKRCSCVWLITTNDNERAAQFYEKRGFNLEEVSYGAVDDSRKIKPSIPLKGENGIEIKDELKFSLML